MKNKGIIVYTFAANKIGNKSVNKLYLLLGGNQGNTVQILQSAHTLTTQKIGAITASSPIYETAAWGKTDQPNFLNQAIEVHTNLGAFEILEQTQQIENQLGRQRNEHWGQRTLDIDILFLNNEVINTGHLCIPHPEIQNRRFALVPLNTISPELIHPVSELSVARLLELCPDNLPVNLFKIF
ncbi:MAG: 2-amino-4-hydroxy-6-hydroxymethyldihydropteridine diphosphokinase [Chitinophagaceae bacterium]